MLAWAITARCAVELFQRGQIVGVNKTGGQAVMTEGATPKHQWAAARGVWAGQARERQTDRWKDGGLREWTREHADRCKCMVELRDQSRKRRPNKSRSGWTGCLLKASTQVDSMAGAQALAGPQEPVKHWKHPPNDLSSQLSSRLKHSACARRRHRPAPRAGAPAS